MAAIPRGRQTTRLETFVDAAFAFAVTMLVISVDSIPDSFDELLQALKGVPAFAASFAITVMFWLGHYRWSRRFGIEDTGSVVLSLSLVFLVLVFLYPLRLMMSGALNAMTGGWLPAEFIVSSLADARAFFFLYGAAFALMATVLLVLNLRVQRQELEPPLSHVDRGAARVEAEVWGILVATGATSATLALVLPARLLVLSGWMFVSLAVIMPAMARRWRILTERAEAADRSTAA
ncbi:MAG: TMEM175 family protein [Steroidobacteraceae bacterium]|nr:TMEM175 family protein [Steroidobacteraceae bacterium]